MKNIFNLLIILTSLVWIISCENVNYLHDKYLAGGEDFLVGKLDSLKYYGGNQRARLVVWDGDFRATKLVINRSDTSLVYTFGLSDTNRKDSMVFYINNLREGTNVLSMNTWNADNTVHSIPMSLTVTTWGSRYKSFLINRTIANNAYNAVSNILSITWKSGNVIEPVYGKYAIGHEIKYVTTTGKDTLVQTLYTNLVTPPTITTLAKYQSSNSSYSYRMLYLPDKACIDTFRTEYVKVVTP